MRHARARHRGPRPPVGDRARAHRSLVLVLLAALAAGVGVLCSSTAGAAPTPATTTPPTARSGPSLPGNGPITSTTTPMTTVPPKVSTTTAAPPPTTVAAPPPTTAAPVTRLAPVAPTTVFRAPAAPPSTASAVINQAPPSTAGVPPADGVETAGDEPAPAPDVLKEGAPAVVDGGPVIQTIATGLPGYAFPFGLAVLIVGFLVTQHFLDRRDPKLREAPFERIDAVRPFAEGP